MSNARALDLKRLMRMRRVINGQQEGKTNKEYMSLVDVNSTKNGQRRPMSKNLLCLESLPATSLRRSDLEGL